MHFFYLDESGDTGTDLQNRDQPILVLGGISLRDEGWNKTGLAFEELIRDFLGRELPADFELHAYELLSPNGGGPFEGLELQRRTRLAIDILALLEERKHGTHFVAFDKSLVDATDCDMPLVYDASRPYLLAFDYMITWINWYVRDRLGQSARGMVILDRKEEHHEDIELILRNRRREGPKVHRVKWIVEVSYPIDSQRNPMIQISDLVIFCVRRFLEIEHGHRDAWSQDAKKFYAQAYDRILARTPRQALVQRGGRGYDRLNEYLEEVRCVPVGQWRRRYRPT